MDSENPTLTNVSEPEPVEASAKAAPRKRGRPARKKTATATKAETTEIKDSKAAEKQLSLLYSSDHDDGEPAFSEPEVAKKEGSARSKDTDSESAPKKVATRKPRARKVAANVEDSSEESTPKAFEEPKAEAPRQPREVKQPEEKPVERKPASEATEDRGSDAGDPSPVEAQTTSTESETVKPASNGDRRERPHSSEHRGGERNWEDRRRDRGDREERHHSHEGGNAERQRHHHHKQGQGGHSGNNYGQQRHGQQGGGNSHNQGGNKPGFNNPHQHGGGNNKNKKQKGKPFQNQKKGRHGIRPDHENWSEPEVPEQALELNAEALQELSSKVNRTDVLNLGEIYTLDLQELSRRSHEAGVPTQGALNRRRLQREWIKISAEQGKGIRDHGLLEVTEEGHGFLVYSHRNYKLSEESTMVPALLIKKYALQTGHLITGWITAPSEESTCGFLFEVESVNGQSPESVAELTPFEELIPYYPTSRILLEMADCQPPWDSIAKRTVDLLTPIGLGQRGLIVAPPRTGKTVLLQNIAHSIRQNQPTAHLIILLVDERPEEVTDFRRQVKGAEIVSSTFDENAESHVHAAEMVIEKARRMVEFGQHVIILLDSITRLARAYNTVMPSSGKILSGGVEANALQRPKRFFGSARNIEGGGSLTILGTALVETGSRMDEVIFEEFKGTGNMELQLDRALADKRIFPAISFERSGTRKEELLYHPEEMAKIYSLRRAMKGVPSNEAMEMLIQRVKKTKTNAEFLMTINR